MKFEKNYEVGSYDIDINDNMKVSYILRYMEEAGDAQMRAADFSYEDWFNSGKSFILIRIGLEVYEEIKKYDKIISKTWTCGAKGATLFRSYSLERDGMIVASAFSVWAVVDVETGSIYRSKDIDLSRYEADEPVQLKIKDRFRLEADLDYKLLGEKEVLPADIDKNLHMNNTNYPNMLTNLIPDILDKTVTSMNIRFMTEASLGAKLKIYGVKLDKVNELDPRAEETYNFVSRIDDKTNIEAKISVRKVKS